MPPVTGRPKITVDTPLTAQEERYVQAIIGGATKRQALEAAEYNTARFNLPEALIGFCKRLERKPNIHARLLTLRAEKVKDGTPPPIAPPGMDAFDPANITQSWINGQAHHVFTQALASEDFSSALRSLDFLAKANGLAERPKVGRPKTVYDPNKGDVDGNFVEGSDAEGEANASQSDSLFVGLDDGVGSDAASGDTNPYFKKSGTSAPFAGAVQRDRTDRVSKRVSGLAREDGEELFTEVEGE